jgi:uncharacterized delta-60 repeat protein
MMGLASVSHSKQRVSKRRVRSIRRASIAAVDSLESRTLFATYNIVDLGVLGDPTPESVSVNGSAQAAVTLDDGSGNREAARYSAGSTQNLGTFGGSESIAADINSSGQVAGTAGTGGSNPTFIAFFWDGSTKQNLGTLGGDYSVGEAMNDSGAVVGFSQTGDASNPEHAFLWQNGTMTDLGTLGDVSFDKSEAYAINNNGQIAGQTSVSGTTGLSIEHAFVRTGGTMTDIGTLNQGDTSQARGINDAGTVVGWSNIAAGETSAHRAFKYNGQISGLGTLSGDVESEAYDINNNGDVVGISGSTDFGSSKAFVFLNGQTMQDLNTLIPAGTGWSLQQANSISDNGIIGGFGTINGVQHAFMLVPTGGGGGGGDVTAPTATINPAAATLGASSVAVSVTYTDETAVNVGSINTGNIQVTGPGGPLTIQSATPSPNSNAGTIAVTYQVAAPGGTWDAADDGTYTVTVLSSQVRDTSSNPAAATSSPFSVSFADVAGPHVSITPVANITTAGGTGTTVTVTYTDADNVDFSSIDGAEITISGGGAASLPASIISAIPSSDASSIVVTYAFAPPGGTWDAADDDTYTISIDGSKVQDSLGNFATSATATFEVNIPVQVPTLDPAFAGANPVGAGFVAEKSITDLDGKIYVVGHSGDLAGGTSAGIIKRFNPDGSVDSKFGSNGQVTTPAGENDAFYNVAFDPAGKLIVVSGARGGDFLAQRYAIKNGKLDSHFGVRGAALADLAGPTEAGFGLAVAPDNSVYIGGGTAGGFAVLHFDKRGRLDANFGNGGSTIVAGGTDGAISSLILQRDGALLAAGDGGGNVFVARFLATGSLDPAFNGGAAETISALAVRNGLSTPDHTIGLALSPDGKILVANRTAAGDFGVVRMDAAGTLDTSFGGGDGVTAIDFGGDDDADAVLVQGTGQIFVVGTTNGSPVSTAIAALDGAGNLDPNFDEDGKFVVAGAVSDPATSLVVSGTVYSTSAALEPDGQLVVMTSSSSPTSGSGIRRLNVPGSGNLGQFGTVAGKNRKLTFTDADGTKTTLSLKGGTATALYNGSTLDLIVTGSSLGSSLSIKGKGGDGRTTLGNIRTDGSLKSFSAKTGDIEGTMYVAGELKALSIGTLSGNVAAAANIDSASFGGDLAGAKLLAGANLGTDALIGGGDDTFAAAIIGKMSVKGAVAASIVGAGFDPVDGDFTNGGLVVGGPASVIKSISVKKAVDAASRFFAGAFGKIKAPGKVTLPDERFQVL